MQVTCVGRKEVSERTSRLAEGELVSSERGKAGRKSAVPTLLCSHSGANDATSLWDDEKGWTIPARNKEDERVWTGEAPNKNNKKRKKGKETPTRSTRLMLLRLKKRRMVSEK
ncbi:hypothetical protein M406DRAFT_102977 [Cryphonectria parasitica EP155]|uniref:Uncharacterized protein n=1 Tax=Cryphonectria parasitica (strain ATCC 38755 / EP155) TaxID=660469 RepID=A0A9P4YAH8_CRYP1|nr:uncharacterized protein M406DRAFT_102977 [Cryphonectria parasitica EP155]KAF3769080.1 hypothetical protein M406DRAFT_102977 [Cryphonectria parasitica EP155]